MNQFCITIKETKLVAKILCEEVGRCGFERKMFNLDQQDKAKSYKREKEAHNLLHKLLLCGITLSDVTKSVEVRPELN